MRGESNPKANEASAPNDRQSPNVVISPVAETSERSGLSKYPFIAKWSTTPVYEALNETNTDYLQEHAGVTVESYEESTSHLGGLYIAKKTHYKITLDEARFHLSPNANSVYNWFITRLESALRQDNKMKNEVQPNNEESRYPFLYRVIAQLIRASLSTEKSGEGEKILQQLSKFIERLLATPKKKDAILDPKSHTAMFLKKYYTPFIVPNILTPIIRHNAKLRSHLIFITDMSARYDAATIRILRSLVLLIYATRKSALAGESLKFALQDASLNALTSLERILINGIARLTKQTTELTKESAKLIAQKIKRIAFETSDHGEQQNEFYNNFFNLLVTLIDLKTAREELLPALRSLNDSIGAMWLIGGLFDEAKLKASLIAPLEAAIETSKTCSIYISRNEQSGPDVLKRAYKEAATITGALNPLECSPEAARHQFSALFEKGHLLFLQANIENDIQCLEAAASKLGQVNLVQNNAFLSTLRSHKVENDGQGTKRTAFVTLPTQDDAKTLEIINEEYPDDPHHNIPTRPKSKVNSSSATDHQSEEDETQIIAAEILSATSIGPDSRAASYESSSSLAASFSSDAEEDEDAKVEM